VVLKLKTEKQIKNSKPTKKKVKEYVKLLSNDEALRKELSDVPEYVKFPKKGWFK